MVVLGVGDCDNNFYEKKSGTSFGLCVKGTPFLFSKFRFLVLDDRP